MFSGLAPDLHSERLCLRVPRRKDLVVLHEAICESLDALTLWLPWAQPSHSESDTREYLRGARRARQRRHSFEFLIEGRDDRRLLGMTSLHRVDWTRRCAGLGYWIRRDCWGKGLATEAASTLLSHGFVDLGLERVEVHIALQNTASQRVAEKLGLTREGTARAFEYINGRYLDHIQYSALRDDDLCGWRP